MEEEDTWLTVADTTAMKSTQHRDGGQRINGSLVDHVQLAL